MKMMLGLYLLELLLVCATGFPQQNIGTPGRAQQSVGAGVGVTNTPGGPFVAVGTSAGSTVGSGSGVQAVSAGTRLQGGGGFGFGSNQVTSTATREGFLPIHASSGSTLVSTADTALGSSQASTISTQPSSQTGVPSRVSASQAQVSALGVRGGLVSQQRHVGRIEVGPNGPRASIGGAVERQMTQAGQHASNLGRTTQQLQAQAAGFLSRTVQGMGNIPPVGQAPQAATD